MAVSQDVKDRLQAIHARMGVQSRMQAAHDRVTASSEEMTAQLRAQAVATHVVGALRELGYSDRQIVAGLEGEDLPDLEDGEIITSAEDFGITDDEIVEATVRTLSAMGETIVDEDDSVDDLALTGSDVSDDDLNDLSEVLEGYSKAAVSATSRTKLMARLTASLNCLLLTSARDLSNNK